MSPWVTKAARSFFFFGLTVALALFAYLLEQRSSWAWLRLLLGVGAVLAFYLGLERGVAFNLPQAIGLSLLAMVLLYFVLDLLFPGTVAHRVGQLAGDPFQVGTLLALLLFRPGHGAVGPAKRA
jgi:hypothetical protein